MRTVLKPLAWVGSTLEDLRSFPIDVRQAAGHELLRVQAGLMPTDWKPMPIVGPGVHEIRIRTGVEHRVLYVARFAEAIYVLHAFAKRTQKTAGEDIDIGRRRLRDLVRARVVKKGTP